MTIKYSDAQVAELRAVGTLDYDTATAFSEKHGISVRSVIAKARALDVPYRAKVPGQKATAKGPDKAALIKQIEKAFGVDLPSMSKMTALDLTRLVEALA